MQSSRSKSHEKELAKSRKKVIPIVKVLKQFD